MSFTGPARVFDQEEQMLKALEDGESSHPSFGLVFLTNRYLLADSKSFEGSVIIIRYEGPKGGPGMPEMLTPTSAIMGAGLGDSVAMLTDGRFSGGS